MWPKRQKYHFLHFLFVILGCTHRNDWTPAIGYLDLNNA